MAEVTSLGETQYRSLSSKSHRKIRDNDTMFLLLGVVTGLAPSQNRDENEPWSLAQLVTVKVTPTES